MVPCRNTHNPLTFSATSLCGKEGKDGEEAHKSHELTIFSKLTRPSTDKEALPSCRKNESGKQSEMFGSPLANL